MLEILIMIIPALLAALQLAKCRKEKICSWRVLLYTVIGAVAANTVTRGGLWLIGLKSFRLSDMGMSFQLNYCFVELFLLEGSIAIYKLLRKEIRDEVFAGIKQVLPAMLFLIMTFCIFMPSSLFLGNITEFSISYADVLPVIAVVSVVFAVGIIIFAMVLSGKKSSRHYTALIFAVALALYVQGNFLNPKLPELDGRQIEWAKYATSGAVSICFWIVSIVGLQIFMWVWKNKAVKIMSYVACFFSAVQLLTLITILITADKPGASDIALTKEDEFTVGTDNNVIVFVVDSIESAIFEGEIVKSGEFQDDLENFTFYSNMACGGAYTQVAMPLLMTGVEYDPLDTTYNEYLYEAWASTDLYTDLDAEEFDVRIFSDPRYITGVSDGMIDNAVPVGNNYYINNYALFTKDLYKFTAFYAMPQCLKQAFWLYGDDILNTISATGFDEKSLDLEKKGEKIYYTFNDVQYYHDFKEAGELNLKYQNAFRMYHLFGGHHPYTMNENIERVKENDTTGEQQIRGTMKIAFEYIQGLKDAGVYDNSTIIITADHGGHGYGRGIEQNPMFLVKEANISHEFTANTAPIHFRNVVATIAKAAFGDYAAYGPSIYDIDENSDVERLHTVISEVGLNDFPDASYEYGFLRCIIPADARDTAGITVHDPYAINRFPYVMGDTIAFTQDNPYAKNMTYRLYQENSTGIASNELSICAELENYNGGDVEFSFAYNDVYNDSQMMRIYAKGTKVASITCTAEGTGQENTVLIPKECIKDNVLVLRMVFPNAVTPHQLDASNQDTRVLSVAFESMKIGQ